MAKQVIVRLTDDIDGGEADETVPFALDGVGYEIDLSTGNAEQLRMLLAPFVVAGRKAPRPVSATGRDRRQQGTDRDQNAQVRAWAAANGVTLNSRGRIPAEVVAQWMARQR